MNIIRPIYLGYDSIYIYRDECNRLYEIMITLGSKIVIFIIYDIDSEETRDERRDIALRLLHD